MFSPGIDLLMSVRARPSQLLWQHWSTAVMIKGCNHCPFNETLILFCFVFVGLLFLHNRIQGMVQVSGCNPAKTCNYVRVKCANLTWTEGPFFSSFGPPPCLLSCGSACVQWDWEVVPWRRGVLSSLKYLNIMYNIIYKIIICGTKRNKCGKRPWSCRNDSVGHLHMLG